MTHSHKCQCGERCRPRCGATTEARVPSSRFWKWLFFCNSSGILLAVLMLLLRVILCKWACGIICNLKVHQHLLRDKSNWYILTWLESDASVNIETCYSALSHTHWPIYLNRTQYTEYRLERCFCFLEHMNPINQQKTLSFSLREWVQRRRHGGRKQPLAQSKTGSFVWCCIGKTVSHLNHGPRWQTLARQCERDRQLLWGSVVFSR